MSVIKHKPHARFRRGAIITIAALSFAAAISPAAAASPLAQMDKGALALIAAITTLTLAIIIEVWRQTMPAHKPARIRSRDSHE